jgi:hypothetical protein
MTFITGLAVAILQGFALSLTVHGDAHVSSEYDYYNTSSAFKEYYDKYSSPDNSTFGNLKDPVIPHFDHLLAEQNFTTRIPYRALDWNDYFQEYANTSQASPDNNARITPCVFDWNALAKTPSKFSGGDPCAFSINDEDPLACIGDWTGKYFQRFWCYAFHRYSEEQERNKNATSFELEQREITTRIRRLAVESLSAFYRHNEYFIGWLGVSLIISVIAVTLDDIFRGPKQITKLESESAVKS